MLTSLRLPPELSKFPPEVVAPLLYDAGLTIERVAVLCGYGATRTRQILLDAGVQLRRPGTRKNRQPKALDLIELYETGLDLNECATLMRKDWHAVRQQLVDAGVQIRTVGRPTSKRRSLIQLYRSGLSIQSCADILGLSYGTARKRLLNAGIELRARGIRIQFDDVKDVPKLVSLYESGASVDACAQYFGIAYSSAHYRLINAGVTLRQPGRNTNRRRPLKILTPPTPLPSCVVPELHRLKFTMHDIVRFSGLSRVAVHRELAQAGLPARVNPDPFGIPLDGLVDVYRVVASVKDTATVFRISSSAVTARLREACFGPLGRPDAEATPVRLEEQSAWRRQDMTILALAASGRSTWEIARTVGKSAGEVGDILGLYHHRDHITALILRGRQHGESPGVTAIRLGLRLESVSSVLARYSVKPRSASRTTALTAHRAPALPAGRPARPRELVGRR